MKVRVIGPRPSFRNVYRPWWDDMIGEIIEVDSKPFYWDIAEKYVYILKDNPKWLIEIEYTRTLRKEKIKRLLNG